MPVNQRQKNAVHIPAEAISQRPDSIRVAMLIQSYYPWIGGAERQLQALCAVFPLEGVEVLVITRRHRGPGYTPRAIVAGAPVYRIPVVGGFVTRSLSYTIGALWLLFRRQRNIDVVHAHDILSPTTAAVLSKVLLRKPVVIKMLRSGELGDVAQLRARRFGRIRMALITRLVDRFICISDEVATELAAAGVPGGKLMRIPNGVDTDEYAPASGGEKQTIRDDLSLPHEAPVVIFVGRLAPEKGLRDLATAWEKVVTKFPTAHMLIVGTGPEEAALTASKAPNIHLLGARQDISQLLRASDIFVLPSQGEGLSNALLEAMASGLACVGSDVGGTRELLQHQRNGVLVPYGSPPALSEALALLIADPDQRQRLGEAARQTIERSYSLRSTARQLRSLYISLLSPRHRASRNWM